MDTNGLYGGIVSRPLLQVPQSLLYFRKIRQVLRGRRLLAVLDDAIFINHERRPRRRVTDTGKHRKYDIIFLYHFLVEIARERDANLLFLRPGFLRERSIHADRDDARVQSGVSVERARDVAHFTRANAGERRGEEEQHGVLFAEVIA